MVDIARDEKGFTLIEVLASVVILSVFVTAMIGLLGQSYLYSKVDIQREIARSYAVTEISSLLQDPQTSLTNIGTAYNSPNNMLTKRVITGPDGNPYTVKEYMTSSLASNGENQYTVGVTVTWGPGASHSLTLKRLFYHS